VSEGGIREMKDLRCLLGLHDFKFDHADEQFMPKVRVLVAKCKRESCIEKELVVEWLEKGYATVKNYGFNRLVYGNLTNIPLREVRKKE